MICSPTCGRCSSRSAERSSTPKSFVPPSMRWRKSPWSTANRGQPIDGNYLHRHLRDFIPGTAEAIAPRKFYVGGVEARGYNEKHFQDAFSRYLGRPLPSDARKADGAQESPAGPMPPPGGLKTPVAPVAPSQNAKKRSCFNGLQGGGCAFAGCRQPVATPWRRARPQHWRRPSTGKDGAPAAKNSEPDEAVKGRYDGATGATGTLRGVGEAHTPAGGLPRGARGRGKAPRRLEP